MNTIDPRLAGLPDQSLFQDMIDTIDSPPNYPCPTCGVPVGVACGAPIGVFHPTRRAARMAALAKASTPPSDRRYVRGNLNHGDRTEGHRVTYIKRSAPRLFTQRELWEKAVRRTVDSIFESQTIFHNVDGSVTIEDVEVL